MGRRRCRVPGVRGLYVRMVALPLASRRDCGDVEGIPNVMPSFVGAASSVLGAMVVAVAYVLMRFVKKFRH
jgi:hypothetical protein